MFHYAEPVWLPDHQCQPNTHLIFFETLETLQNTRLFITAADFYKLYLNDQFLGFGPARAAKGFARVDEYDLSLYPQSTNGSNTLRIEVAGYHCHSLSTVYQPSFLVAEIVANDQVIRYTGRDFPCYENTQRMQYVERFSVQRHFGEIYDRFLSLQSAETVPLDGSHRQKPRYISRHVPMAHCALHDVTYYSSLGTFDCGHKEPTRINAYSFPIKLEPDWGSFPEENIKHKPYRFINSLDLAKTSQGGDLPITLSAGEWLLVDLHQIECGFLRWSGCTHNQTDLIVAFTETCDDHIFSFSNVNMQTVIEYHLPPCHNWDEESFEPYTFKYVAFFVKQGELTLNRVGFRTFERDMTPMLPRKCADPISQKIYNAAVRTFAHNAVDLFSDCPSRERAGWLCDSYFTGRAEYFLFGKCPVEEAFLENYVLYHNEGEFPEGVLPMVYPSDPHQNNKFIPQWNLWYMLEVCEFLTQRSPQTDLETFRPSVDGLLKFFAQYENELGLLEHLPSWNFIEWSDANTWVQDVNYPTNMLYAGALEAAADVFGYSELLDKADHIRRTVINIAFDGEVFVDQAQRGEDGQLHNLRNVSEACQYYAILYGNLDLDDAKYTALKAHIMDGFKHFDLKDSKFCPINAFIGLYLRMNVLMNLGDRQLLADNMKEFFSDMCDATNTLWENRTTKGSLDHGFASYVLLTLPYENDNQ